MGSRKRSVVEAEPRRRSGRVSVPKSAYFENSEAELNEEVEEEEEVKPALKKRRGKAQQVYKNQDDRPQKGGTEDDDDEDDDDDVRRVEIIPLENMRDEGGVGYEAHKLHKNTLLFLQDLKANNQRSWLKAHDGEYRRALKDWQSFVEVTTATLIEADETVPELPVKDVIFRIHRDIRFSKDPTPYKPHFSAAWSRTGRKGPYAAYYLHCEPRSCFIGGGLWQPEAGQLARLRESIDERPGRWRRVLNDALFKEVFLPGGKMKGDEEEDAVRAFVAGNQKSALKKKPMGYEITHRDIELLKLRSFTVTAKIKDESFCSDAAQDKIGRAMRALCPFVSFLNSIVMPDPNVDADEEEEDEQEEEVEEDENEEEEEEEEESEP